LFEPAAGFAAFATRDEEKISAHGFAIVGESGSKDGQHSASTLYQAMGVEPHTVMVERDENSGFVTQITHVREMPTNGMFRTNQINYKEGILSSCSNASGIKLKNLQKAKPKKEVTCSTVSRETCDKGSRKKELQTIQSQHFSSMSAQLKQVTNVKVGQRNPKNGAMDKKTRNELCAVLNQQPQFTTPSAPPTGTPSTNAEPASSSSGESK
jgi:hypothetical protein